VRLAAEGDAARQSLLDGGQALQGETLGDEGGIAGVELHGGGLGGGQLLLLLRLGVRGRLSHSTGGG